MSEVIKEFYNNGQLKQISYIDNVIWTDIWTGAKTEIKGLHNESGPAQITYWDNGNQRCATYAVNAKTHRIDGPAVIYYDYNGEIIHEYYHLDNKWLEEINNDDEFKKYVKRLILR